MQKSSTLNEHKSNTKMPDGLLQSTEITDAVTVTIKRLIGDDATEDVLSFTNAPDIQSFYARRGVALGITQATNVIAVRVLALDLHKKSQSQQKLGLDSAPQTAEHARRLYAAASSLKKDDALVCSFVLERPPIGR